MTMMEMDSLIGELAADWQLDQPLGLTLFDDAPDSLGQAESVKRCSTAHGVVEHVSRGDHWEGESSQA